MKLIVTLIRESYVSLHRVFENIKLNDNKYVYIINTITIYPNVLIDDCKPYKHLHAV